MADKALPSPDTLRQLLRYEPDTGKLFWRHRPCEMFRDQRHWKMWNTRFSGKEALTAVNSDGYRHGTVLGQTVKAHAVVWAIFYGHYPILELDHEDGRRDCNVISNLRDVSHSVNCRNQRLRSTNISGVNGVSWNGQEKKWAATIRVCGKVVYLGRYVTIEDAANARKAADESLGIYHPNHGRKAS